MVTKKQETNWLVVLFCLAVVIGLIYVFLINIPKAQAWTYGVSGSAVCEKDGWKVSWLVDNETENEPLHIQTSNRSVVPAPVDVPANSSETYTETVTEDVTLTLTGNWSGDEQIRERSATVEFEGDCVPETPPPVVVPPEIKQLPNTSVKE